MRETGTRWYVFGAQAASHWGRPRMTADVDVTAMLAAERIDEFISTMVAHGFALRVDDRAFVERTRVLPFIYTPTSYPVDVVMAGPGLEEEFLRRAVNVEIHQTHLPVISAEDFVIAKILAGRAKDIEGRARTSEYARSRAHQRSSRASRTGTDEKRSPSSFRE
jgi:hypothetical protein